MADRGGLQLLPEVRRSIEIKKPGENRHLVFSVLFFGFVLLLTLGSLIYAGSLRNQLTSLDVVISNLDSERNLKAEEKIIKVKDQLKIASELLNSHLFWSKGLTKIQNKTSLAIKYQNIDASLDKFSFKALAPNYSSVARQIANYLSEDSIKDLEVTQLKSLTTGQVEFLVNIFFDKDKFLQNKQEKNER